MPGAILQPPRTLLLAASGRIATGAAAATRIIPASGGTAALTGTTTVAAILRLVAADLAIAGVTPKLRVAVELLTNATAPAASFTIGFYPLASVAGGTNLLAYTLGAVIAGSTVAIGTPAASTISTGNSTVISLPADGPYLLGVVNDATTAANSEVHVTARLELIYV